MRLISEGNNMGNIISDFYDGAKWFVKTTYNMLKPMKAIDEKEIAREVMKTIYIYLVMI